LVLAKEVQAMCILAISIKDEEEDEKEDRNDEEVAKGDANLDVEKKERERLKKKVMKLEMTTLMKMSHLEKHYLREYELLYLEV